MEGGFVKLSVFSANIFVVEILKSSHMINMLRF